MHLLDTILNDPHLVKYYICSLLMIVPLARIYMRAGFKPYWALLLGVPDAGFLLCLVVMAFGKWSRKEGV